MAITRTQAWTKATKVDGAGSTVTNTLVSVPTAGNLLVAWLQTGDGGGAASIVSFSDNTGDGVSAWTEMTTSPTSMPGGSNTRIRGYYKVVGTPSGGLKAVQCTISGTQALVLFVAEYSDTSVTWTVDGSQVSAAAASVGPANAGSITTTGTNSVLIGCALTDGGAWTAGTNYTSRGTDATWAEMTVEDRVVSSAASYAVDYTSSSGVSAWAAMGIAFKAAAAGPTISTITGTTATEGTDVVFTATMSGTGGGTYAYSWSGTATSADYTTTLTSGMFTTTGGSGSVTVSGSNITVGASVTAFTVTVPTTADSLDEDSETVRLVIDGTTASSGTITDDDAEPSITGTTSATVDAGDPVVITYTLSAVSGRTITRTLTVTDGTATGGGTDYTSTITDGMFATTSGSGTVTISGSTVTIPAGVGAFTLTIPTTA